MNSFKDIEKQAAQWLAREDRGLNHEGGAALEAWLNGNSANRVAYLQLKAVWQRADRLAALRSPETLIWPHASRPTVNPAWRIAAAFALFIAFGSGALYFYTTTADSYGTEVGQIQTVRLSDGSRIEMNTDTHLTTKLTSATRTVKLDRGEAFFDVVHDAHRPFVVLAGNRRITDIGTKFTVRREGDDVDVTVMEGRVRIEALNGSNADAVIGNANDMLVSKRDGTLVAKTRAEEVQNAMSWRRGLLVFNQATLADAAQEFNRYNHKKLVVVGTARNIMIGGAFRANNLDAFAALVKTGLRLKVEEKDGTIVVSK